MRAGPPRRRADGARGFTLLELIVAVAILSILAGAVLPVASRVVDRAARKSTRAELEALGAACLEHFRDTGRLPGSVAELLTDPAAAGWTGPYLALSMADSRTGEPGWELDGWSRPYRFESLEHGLCVASLGRDGAPGEDDLAVTVDVRPVLREETLEVLGIVNRAVAAWYAGDGAEPLPAELGPALERLVGAGLLPESAPFQRDAWGRELVADPPGGKPLVRVRSPSIAPPQAFQAEDPHAPAAGGRERRAALDPEAAWRRAVLRARGR